MIPFLTGKFPFINFIISVLGIFLVVEIHRCPRHLLNLLYFSLGHVLYYNHFYPIHAILLVVAHSSGCCSFFWLFPHTTHVRLNALEDRGNAPVFLI